MRKPEIPFAKLFKRVPPKDFVALFSPEFPQTIAFILSFSPSRGYIKKVLYIFDDIEAQHPGNDADTLEGKTSFIIRNYLKYREESFDRVFVSELEQEVNRMIADYEDPLNFRKLRRSFFR
jgi:flagellar motor switch protein FliG